MLQETFKKRFAELAESFKKLRFLPRGGSMSGTYVASGEWQRWGTSAQNLILAVFGRESPHYTNYVAAYADCGGGDQTVRRLHGIFESAKDDFESGCVFNVDLRISGEVFGDFVALAKQALTEGHKDVAAVLACAALEDALKRYAAVNGLIVESKTMVEIVGALKGAGLVTGAQKTLLDTMPKVRNYAMHAEWTKINDTDVSSVLGFVEQLLLSKFGGA